MAPLIFLDENADQWSSKSVSPSPIVGTDRTNHPGIASSHEGRDVSVNLRNSSDNFKIDADSPDTSVPRDDFARYPNQFSKQLQHGGSTISLGVRQQIRLFRMNRKWKFLERTAYKLI